MGCQRAIAEQVADQQGDYVLSLKGNQRKPTTSAMYSTTNEEELDKGHDRLETRRYWVSDVLQSLPDTHKWKGLKSIGMVERERLEADVKSIERHYFKYMRQRML